MNPRRVLLGNDHGLMRAGVRALLVLALASPSGVAQTAVEPPRSIRVVMDNNYAPYSFQSDEGKLEGLLNFEAAKQHKINVLLVDNPLAAMEPGELKQIEEKTFGRTINRLGSYLTYAGYAAAAAILLIAGLAGWNRTLKKKILQRTRALSESEQRFRRLIELMPVAIYVCDTSGIIQTYNHRAVELWGRAPKPGDTAQLYCGSLRLYSPEGELVPHEKSRMAEVLRTGVEARDLEVVIERPDGSCLTVLVNIAPLRNGEGELVGAMNCFQDITERKRAEALLHAREQEFRAIVENAPDQIIRYDRELRRTYANPAVAKAYGLSAEALTGKPIGSVIQDAGLDVKDDDLAQVRQQIKAVFETGQSSEYEMKWPLPTGRRYYNVRLFPELDLNGSVINVLGITRDITERRIAEEELQKEKEILAKIFDNIPVLVGFVDADGVTLVNPEWERTMGWTLKELQEQNVDIFAEAYPDLSYRQEVLDFVAAATGEWADLKIKVRDGRVIDAACAVVHLSDGTKVAIAQDITERKQAEEALRQAERKYRDIFQNAGEGIFQSTPDGRYIAANPALACMYGFASPDELIHNLRDISAQVYVDSTRREEFKRQIEEQGAVRGFEHEVFRQDGSRLWISVNAHVVRDEQGAIQYYEGTAQDITARKRAAKELEAANHRLRDLSRRLFEVQEEERRHLARELHDEIGQALTAAKITLQSVAGHAGSPTIARVQETTAILDRLLGQVRQISLDLRPSMLDDLGLIPALRSLVDQQGRRASVEMRFFAETLPETIDTKVQTTCFRIAQEAITNALRHAHATRVEVDLRRDDDTLRLVIRDNGTGFDAESAQAQTLGLGLIGMKERAALVGGRAKIISSPNKGTTIEVSIPLMLRAENLGRGIRK